MAITNCLYIKLVLQYIVKNNTLQIHFEQKNVLFRYLDKQIPIHFVPQKFKVTIVVVAKSIIIIVKYYCDFKKL